LDECSPWGASRFKARLRDDTEPAGQRHDGRAHGVGGAARLGMLAYRRAGGGQGGSPEPGGVHGGVLLGSALDILRAGVPGGGLHGRAVFMGLNVPDDQASARRAPELQHSAELQGDGVGVQDSSQTAASNGEGGEDVAGSGSILSPGASLTSSSLRQHRRRQTGVSPLAAADTGCRGRGAGFNTG
jgi:hypothetical protein